MARVAAVNSAIDLVGLMDGVRSPQLASIAAATKAAAPATARAATLSHVAELLALGERAELLQALVLDLADPLARHLEDAADLVEGLRLLAVQAVAELEDAPLAVAERAEAAGQRLDAECRVGRLVGQRLALVLDEVAELRVVVVP